MSQPNTMPNTVIRILGALVTTVLLLAPGVLVLVAAEDHSIPAQEVCDAPPEDDPLRLDGWFVYFNDEFNCINFPAHWSVQGTMGPAAYTPPPNGYVQVADGALQVGVHGEDVSFPYLYLVDDSATTYDIPFSNRRVDWIPNQGDFRLAMRVRFHIEDTSDHRVSLYADGHTPSYAGPLFYVSADNDKEVEAWRGIVVGADRGNRFVDMGDYGYPDDYADWITVVIDHRESEDRFTVTVDGAPLLEMPLSAFKEHPYVATRPDVLYLGSLAYLEYPTGWIDVEIDWLRVYAPSTTPPAQSGIQRAIPEAAPVPKDAPGVYSTQLPPGPFANTPHWAEDFDGDDATMPSYWRLLLDNDPENSDTDVADSHAVISNDGNATAVPVWGIYDDLRRFVLPPKDDAARYLAQRTTTADAASARTALADAPEYVDWRPNHGNVRYAWKARQSAEGYGVEVSNGGHVPYFTGAIFYTLLDTTTPGGGQFIFPTCQEKYFWRLHRLPAYAHLGDMETIVTADYINGTAFFYVDGERIGWWPESDCSLNWFVRGENATQPDLLFFGNPADGPGGRWSEVGVDWFVTFPGLDAPQLADVWLPQQQEIVFDWNAVDDLDDVDQLTATLRFSVTEGLRWQGHLSGQADWLHVTPLSGTVPFTATPATGQTSTLPPKRVELALTVTRPLTYSIQSTLLTLNGETISGTAVAPHVTEIRSVYRQTLPHRNYLPQLRDDAQ
ncbi:MAG: hypothetical protein R2873_04950 [Caldilineaceae bacterium]